MAAYLWTQYLRSELHGEPPVNPCKTATTEGQVYNSHCEEFFHAIVASHPEMLVPPYDHQFSVLFLLVHNGLIEEGTKEAILLSMYTAKVRAKLIVNAVAEKIDSDPQYFHRLLQVLKGDSESTHPFLQQVYGGIHPVLRTFGEKLSNAYSTASAADVTMPGATFTRPPQAQGQDATAREEPIIPTPRPPALEERPTMPQLLQFKKNNGEIIDITREIGANYTKLGIILLQDNQGARVKALEQEHQRNAEHINCEILLEWINGRGLQPATWRKLIEVLVSIGLKVLADDIKDSL